MEQEQQRIKKKLNLLLVTFQKLSKKRGDSGRDLQHLLHPKLRLKDLKDFEKKHQVVLPKPFVTFLTQVGNGGVGPGNGLSPLCLMYSHPQLMKIKERRYNESEEDENDEDEKLDPSNPENAWVICICNYWYGQNGYLVISGPHYGEVWYEGEEEFILDSKNFLLWYEKGLDYRQKELNQSLLKLKSQPVSHQAKKKKEPIPLSVYEEKLLTFSKQAADRKKNNSYQYENDSREKLQQLIDFYENSFNKEALERVKNKFLTISDKTMPVWIAMGWVHLFLQEKEQARQAFKKALEEEPEKLPRYYYMWRLIYGYATLGDYDSAFQLLNQSKDFSQGSFYRTMLNHKKETLIVEMGNWQPPKTDDHGNADFCLAEAYERLGHLDKAISHYQQAQKLGYPSKEYLHPIPKTFVALYQITFILINKRKYQEAIEILKTIPKEEKSLNLIGQCYLALFQEAQAKVCFLPKDLVASKHHLASALAKQAKAYFEESFSLNYNLTAYIGLGDAYACLRQWKKAKIILEEAIACAPDYADVSYDMACLYAMKKNIKSAKAWLKLAYEQGFPPKEAEENPLLKILLGSSITEITNAKKPQKSKPPKKT